MGDSSKFTRKDKLEIEEFKTLLWGNNIRPDVFRRWSQGFEFSEWEPSALVQHEGGPCAVIAPVQAYLLKILMDTPNHCLKDLTPSKCKELLIRALCSVLVKSNVTNLRIASLSDEGPATMKEGDDTVVEHSCSFKMVSEHRDESLSKAEEFHHRLSVINFHNIDDATSHLSANYECFMGTYGVLLFLYSVLLTKGIENIASELSDMSEPLIDNVYGYGSQALINLMLTGQAVAHVWDNEQDVGGLKLRGITKQSEIGFITLMEQMRYCTVGSFFKNPKHPVWVMGSDTHLTVLFSYEKRLVSPETPSEIARRVFKSFDPEDNNFISTSFLQDVLESLNLVSDPEYVDLMQKKLDPEGLGIILLNAFMEEFFPIEKRSTPDTFELLHYNGIPGSNEGNKVHYIKGVAILLESDINSVCVSNPMLTCLQTKWPNIDVNWSTGKVPSLN